MIGFVGCVVPILPGPIIGYCGLLALIPTEKCPSALVLVTMGLVVAERTRSMSLSRPLDRSGANPDLV